MIEPPTVSHNETENTVEKAKPGTSEAEKQDNKRLGIKEFIITLIIIILVWAGRRFFGR